MVIAGNALPIRVYHRVIRRDHLQASFGLTDGDILPGFVSSEIRKREPVWHCQREPVLSRDCHAAQDSEQCHERKRG